MLPRCATISASVGLTCLSNNAGICAYGLADELTEQARDMMLDINLRAPGSSPAR